MTSSLPNFTPAPAPAGSAPQSNAGFAGFGASTSSSQSSPSDFDDLMSEQDAAAVCPETATATPAFTILAPTLISLLATPTEASTEVVASPGTAAAEEAAPTLGGVTRDMMEQAASLLGAILQTLMPAATPVVPVATGMNPGNPAPA